MCSSSTTLRTKHIKRIILRLSVNKYLCCRRGRTMLRVCQYLASKAFKSTKRRAESSIVSYVCYRFMTAYN